MQLRKTVRRQYGSSDGKIDFAHMQMALAARLAYSEKENGVGTKLGVICSTEDASYFAGWLGDAVLSDGNGTTSLKNAIYYGDLLKDEQYHWEVIKSKYLDTYNFLLNLNAREANVKEY